MINLDEIERRANAATPGPWRVGTEGFGAIDSPERTLLFGPNEAAIFWDEDCQGPCCTLEDARFIAAARTDVPALIARVRELEAERDQALADYQDLGRVMHEECARLEAECERMKTFAAKSFSQMMCQEVEQMREYGLSYEGVRKILHEYNDGEISFGKLMDLIRAAARAMAEDNQRAASNLLAIIHGDGGHYEDAHGTVKACKDAEGVVSDLRLKLDAATYALRIERENVVELEERLVLCQRTNDRMRERIGVKPPPWGMNK